MIKIGDLAAKRALDEARKASGYTSGISAIADALNAPSAKLNRSTMDAFQKGGTDLRAGAVALGQSINDQSAARDLLAIRDLKRDRILAADPKEITRRLIGSAKPREIEIPDMSHITRIADEAHARTQREKEQLDLLRRSTIASEQAVADAQRREAEAKADALTAREEAAVSRSHTRAAIWVALASLAVAAWVYLLPPPVSQ